MGFIVAVLVPALTFLTMVVIGLDLRGEDFKRVAEMPRVVVLATLAQYIALPTAVALLASVASFPAELVMGMAVIAACPGGALSNLFTHVANANVALSVTLTAISGVLALVTLPVLVKVQTALLLGSRVDVAVPAARMMGQLALLVLLPIAIGMAARVRYPGWAVSHGPSARNVNVAAGLALVGFVLYDQRSMLAAMALPITALAASYSLLAMAAGAAVGVLLTPKAGDRLTVMIEVSCRNVPVAIVVGATLLHEVRFVVFAAAFFLVQTAFLAGAVGWWRWRTRRTRQASG